MLVPELGIGGAETHVLSLLERLDKSRFAVSLCCLKRGVRSWEERAADLAESFVVLEFRRRNLPLTLIRLVRYLRCGRFDILHCHLSLADSIGRIAGWISRVPVIITTEHGKHLWKSFAHILLERLLARVTDCRICVSHDIIELRKRREGTSEGKLIYIPNGVDLSAIRRVERSREAVMAEFGWNPDDPLILAVGRLVPAKSYQTLVVTVSLLGKQYPELRCCIVGEGRCRDEIAEAIERSGTGDRIRLTGSRTDVPDLLAAAEVFVFTSIREGLPLSLLEAMAAGRAIVGTTVGGIPDAITDGETGLLVPPGDPVLIADAISRLIDDPSLRLAIGDAAARVAEERFSVDSMVRLVGDVYRTTYDNKRK
jgi:glycosyltransferase involved in cell wall biosynthesis